MLKFGRKKCPSPLKNPIRNVEFYFFKKWGICDKIFTFNCYKLHVCEISHKKNADKD